jgi:hypothetical protein
MVVPGPQPQADDVDDGDAPPYTQPPGLGLVGAPFGAGTPEAARRRKKPRRTE